MRTLSRTKQRVAHMQGIVRNTRLQRENIALHGAVINQQIARIQAEAECRSWKIRHHAMESKFQAEQARCSRLVKACRISENCDMDQLPMIHIGTAIDRFDLLEHRDVALIWGDILKALSDKWTDEVTPRICKAIADRVFAPSYNIIERKRKWQYDMMVDSQFCYKPSDLDRLWDSCMDAIKNDKPDQS